MYNEKDNIILEEYIMQCDKCLKDNTSCGMGLLYRNGIVPCPAFDDDSDTGRSRQTRVQATYSVRIQILQHDQEKLFALFEVPANGEEEAKYKVLRLFTNETIAHGDGLRIIEVQRL